MTAATVVASTLLFASAAHAQGRARVRGEVTDAGGVPIAGVQVTAHNARFAPSTFTAVTDERGRWAMIGFGDQTTSWSFTFELEGWVTLETGHTVKPTGRNQDLDVILEPVTETGGSEAAAGVATDATAPENYWQGAAAFDAGDYSAALDHWRTFIADNPEAFPVWLRVAEAHVRLDETAPAMATYERVLAIDADNATALFMLGALKASAGELDVALGFFDRVVEQDPENASLFYNIGEIYFQQGRTQEAIDFYSRSLAIDPEYAAALKQLGFAYVNAGRLQEAIVTFERFLQLVAAESEDAAMVGGVLEALKGAQ